MLGQRYTFVSFTVVICVAMSFSGAIAVNGYSERVSEADFTTSHAEGFAVGDPRRCFVGTASGPSYRFEVLPGGGWDNLRNVEMGQIVDRTYTLCSTTDDRRYLLPDGVITVPVKSSKLDSHAEVFEHWDNYTSTFSGSINEGANLPIEDTGLTISGKFSADYQSVKTRQHYDKAITTRVQAKYLQYTSKLEPGAPLSEPFKRRLYKIAAHLVWGRSKLARYESQLLVRDFGTHVITSIDAGTALVKIDHIQNEDGTDLTDLKLQLSMHASVSFLGIFKMAKVSESFQSDTTQSSAYTDKKISSQISTHGGPVFRPNDFSPDDWASNMSDDLVALDRSGDPIYYLINEAALPFVPSTILFEVYETVKQAVHAYYAHNTYRGCTNRKAKNFSFKANTDDGTCEPPETSFTFGGVYQTCQNFGADNLCDGMTQRNPLTGDFSCPSGYSAIKLQDGQETSSRQVRNCHRCWIIAKCCKTDTLFSSASYSAYWCAATGQIPDKISGYLFGGLFTPTVQNTFTQKQSCPAKFISLSLLKDLKICVSDDYELGTANSLPFAGFFTCKTGNPFSVDAGVEPYPHGCPDGFSQHLATIEEDCEVNYCLKSGAISIQNLPKAQQPPFMQAPKEAFSLTAPEDTEVVSHDGTVWTSLTEEETKLSPAIITKHLQSLSPTIKLSPVIKQADSTKSSQAPLKVSLATPKTTAQSATLSGLTGEEASESGDNADNTLSSPMIVVLTATITTLCILVTTAIVMRLRRRRARYRDVIQTYETRPILETN